MGSGIVTAGLLFMKRMAEIADVRAVTRELSDHEDDEVAALREQGEREVPAGVEIYRITGPFFFGVADRLKSVLRRKSSHPAAA